MSVIESASIARKATALPSGLGNGGPVFERTAKRDGYIRPGHHVVEQPSLALLELVSQGVIVMDADGRMISCNDRFTAMLGLPLFVLLDATLDPYFSPRDAAAFRALQVTDEGGERCGDFSLRHVDNSSVPVRIAVSAFVGREHGERYVAAVFTDLRGERASREKMAAQAEQLNDETSRRRAAEELVGRTLLAGGMASWACELGSGRAMHAVGMHRVLASSSVKTWSRQALIDAFIPSDRATVADAFAVAGVTGSIDIEGRVAGPDATCRWIRLEGRVHANATGTLAGFLSDVTSLREGRDRLRRAAEMEAVGQMAAGIAHDLSNFLQVVGNNLELLGRRAAGDAQMTRLSGSAQRALLRAAKLSRQLLTSSRGQELQLERLLVPAFVTSVRELLDRALPESIRLRIDVADDVWSCTTDLYQLETALLNIAINARDAMPDGGTISIGVENRHVDARCASSWAIAEGDYVMISVSDTGTGMPPEVATRAFEPFFTTKAPDKGTGLGLSQVYAFAKRSNGYATIETEVDRGTRVLLFLPRDGEPVRAVVPLS